MVFSYYLYKYPYKIIWHINKFFRRNKKYIFYCADPLDYEMFQPIAKYLPPVEIVAKNRKSQKYLAERNICFQKMPVFPDMVIMARQMAYKFPVKKIIKIGFDHGLYQFKRWTNSKYYNLFDVYFVSSQHQVEIGRKKGIKTTKAIGYPKLDKAFDGTISKKKLDDLRKELNLDSSKKTIIFTSTWDVEGLSALKLWIDKVHLLTDNYNVLLSVHTWTKPYLIEKLEMIENTHYIDKQDITEYIMISDFFVGDYNSLIGEACALDKPIITFRTPEGRRSIPEVREMIKNISIQIDNFDEIYDAIKHCLKNPNEKSAQRKAANKIMFLKLDGKAGERAAMEIRKMLAL